MIAAGCGTIENGQEKAKFQHMMRRLENVKKA